ncbi:NAD(P)-dependent dehydrogenase, short-chain alcohol dehydrogenase family [Virgibacillus subterraneus]|uniref:NAD(P)-dependent dehydrogenase, short-chain alcohol dehydrogenase family n=1 Tax=Virgibacillus subterraneus TaxID=621109 RepID=A0A1H9G5W8_9BACI|nr:glucose 1-dehydrogenase [Virgibacillus subterraneus]SEQ45555.1 NAD(P)-dependent dehydrogenase, short-chain alcohol dehydrogenase family [Virgibacillus subterraneus]
MKLKGKVAVVTGAGSGIGKATAVALALEGAAVVVSDINKENGVETVNEIENFGGKAFFFRCDVSVDSDMKSLINQTVNKYGKIDILHNNAAIGIRSDITEMSEELWQQIITTNLSSVFRGCKYAIPHLIKNKTSAIVNTSSVEAHLGFPDTAAYASAKGGVLAMSKNLAVQYAKYNLRVNCISPGIINTPMNNRALEISYDPDKLKETWNQLSPIQRIGEPEEVANTVVFLVSNDASFITGEDIRVDGGLVLRP